MWGLSFKKPRNREGPKPDPNWSRGTHGSDIFVDDKRFSNFSEIVMQGSPLIWQQDGGKRSALFYVIFHFVFAAFRLFLIFRAIYVNALFYSVILGFVRRFALSQFSFPSF